MLEQLVTRTDKQDARMDKADARADKQDARADKQDARMDKAEARADKTDAKIDRLEESVHKNGLILEALQPDIKFILEVVTHLGKKSEYQDRLNKEFLQYDHRISAIESVIKKSPDNL